MSTFFFLLCRANPGQGLAIAGLNLIAALALVCASLLLGVAVLLACLHSLGTRVACFQAVRNGPTIASEQQL
jgi:hypothetical protein